MYNIRTVTKDDGTKYEVIEMTRSDYAEFGCVIKDDDGQPYEMQDGDSITMTVRREPKMNSEILFSVTSETDTIIIQHDDTADLEVGEYSADVQLMLADGRRFTFWPDLPDSMKKKERNFKNFILMPEVTRI